MYMSSMLTRDIDEIYYHNDYKYNNTSNYLYTTPISRIGIYFEFRSQRRAVYNVCKE